MAPETAPVLQLREVCKFFGSVMALQGVSFDAYAGEVHAIVGDNGAGKSTAIKIITGIHGADEGEVIVQANQMAKHRSAADTQEQGVSVVYQDLALIECLDIAQNMALGNLPRKFGVVLDRKRMEREAAQVLRDLKVRVGDVRTPVGLLSGGQRQVVAIARAVRMDKPIILLDEPTAALGVQETAHVGEMIDELKVAGKAVLCVSHDLDFVFKHADRVTVLRLGRTVGTRRVTDSSRAEIVGMITGATPADTATAAVA